MTVIWDLATCSLVGRCRISEELAASILRVLEVQKEYLLLVLDYLILKMAPARFSINWQLFTSQHCIVRLHCSSKLKYQIFHRTPTEVSLKMISP